MNGNRSSAAGVQEGVGRSIVRAVVAATLLVSGVVAVARPSTTDASCSPSLEIDQLLDADAIVRGETVGRRRGENSYGGEVNIWTFRVDAALRGAVDRMIEIHTDASDTTAGPAFDEVGPVVALWRNGPDAPFEAFSGCWDPNLSPERVAAVFDPPPAPSSDGPPRAIVAASSRDHSMQLVDVDGDVVRYLASEGLTVGLAPCPDGERFLQLRTPTVTSPIDADEFELVTWSVSTLEPVASVVVPVSLADFSPAALMCRHRSGSSALVVGNAMFEVVDGVASRSDRDAQRITGSDWYLPQLAVFGGSREATLAITHRGAWVEPAPRQSWRVPFISSAGRNDQVDWHLGQTWSVTATLDGGWRVMVDRIDLAIEMSIGPLATRDGPHREVPIRRSPALTVAMLLDEEMAARLPSGPGDAEPLSLLARDGDIVELTDEEERAIAAQIGPYTGEPTDWARRVTIVLIAAIVLAGLALAWRSLRRGAEQLDGPWYLR